MKQILKEWLPPVIVETIRMVRQRNVGWVKEYATWAEALRFATGYAEQSILEKTIQATLEVEKGNKLYERDTVLFDRIEYSWPLLSGLLLAASEFEGVLRVVDFGGSLGSTYRQNIKFLKRLKHLSWCVVEQPQFVDAGKRMFETEILTFHASAQECIDVEKKPNVLVLSSVLQYLESPYAVLDMLLEFPYPYILIDRTPFDKTNRERIMLQVVPPEIYPASYPCWFFNEKKFIAYFQQHDYELVEEFLSNDKEEKTHKFKGMIWRKCENAVKKGV